MIYLFTVLIVLDTAHVLSPMVMAWSRGDFRKVMLRRWPLYILIPASVLGISLAAAPIVDIIVTVYFVWNVWHFASQNYGLLRLAQLRWEWNWKPDWSLWTAVTIVGMTVWPTLTSDPWIWRLINLALFAIPHWVSEIILTSWASTRWKVFAPLILAVGCVGFLWAIPRSTGMPVVGVAWVCFRLGLGFVHFLYDGMIWRFRDPEIRNTIGRAFFGVV